VDVLEVGSIVSGLYRVEKLLASSDHAHVYEVTHIRFEVSLVLKTVALTETADFERDTHALAALTSRAIAPLTDRGQLPDGRPFRVQSKMNGPLLAEALDQIAFTDERVMEVLRELSAAVFEARGNGIGPLDLSIENLMFTDGPHSQLCLLRALIRNATTPDPDADEQALIDLSKMLERPDTEKNPGEPKRESTKDLESTMKSALFTKPPSSEPGTKIGAWRVARQLQDSLGATTYEVVGGPDQKVAVLKIVGPLADKERFSRDVDILHNAIGPNIVKVLDLGTHEDRPYFVMELHEGLSLSWWLKTEGPFSVENALEVVEQMLMGAEELARAGGGPTDFSLDHAFASANPWKVVLTHASLASLGRFEIYSAANVAKADMDPWSAAVALYELLSGRLPFPVTRHSLARMWTGVPMPLGVRRREVPFELSELVNDLIAGNVTMSRMALRSRLAEIRKPALAKPPPPPVPAIKPQPIQVVPAVPPPPGPPPIDWRLEAQPRMRCPLVGLTAAGMRGEEMIAVSADSFGRFSNGTWVMSPQRTMSGGARKLASVGTSTWLAISTDRRLFKLVGDEFVPWGPNLPRFAIYGLTPLPDKRDGAILVGGSTDAGRAIIAKLDGERISIIADDIGTNTLMSAALMPDGSMLAVGVGGAIVRLRGGAVIEVIHPCPNELFVVGMTKHGILVAGSGAWVFNVRPAPLEAIVEKIDTTSALTTLAIDPDGNAWLGADRGRILRRRDQHWRRMNAELPGSPNVLAMQALPTQMRAIFADGTVVYGQPVKSVR
jgi:serine/threonine protein kinase